MERIRAAIRRDDGAVLTILAIVLPLLMLLTAGGVTGFTLYTANRELQRAADQSALAGAAAVPPFDPRVLVEDAAFPIPGLKDTIDDLTDPLPIDPPRIGYPVRDPRAVACSYGSAGLDAESAGLTSAFGAPELFEVPLGEDGTARQTVCDDPRVYPVMRTGSSFDPVECTNGLIESVAEDAGGTELLHEITDPVTGLLDPVLSPIQEAVNDVVEMPLHRVLPAALSPRMHVDVYAHMRPPMLRLITGSDSGRMRASATAYRRLKNAVVVPILPIDQLAIRTGIKRIDQVLTDPENLNRALHAQQSTLIDVVDDADERLDQVFAPYGEACQHILHNLRQDLRDIYDPPTGPVPTAEEIARAAARAAKRTADRTGIPEPDPTNPESLAGDAFLLVGVATDEFMRPVAATQIPILDVALVVMDEMSDGSFRAATVQAANAYGLFRASLVE